MRLNNAPLVEALVEIRWKLLEETAGGVVDPNYQVFFGRLSDRVTDEYPNHERLPTASLPEEFASHLVQHRFWQEGNEHPLLQVGPGIFTFNETEKYDPDDFRRRANDAVGLLCSAYPSPDSLEVESVQLRYINRELFDYEEEDLFSFLRDFMGVEIRLPSLMFSPVDVSPVPAGLSLQSSFPVSSPAGMATVRFSTGEDNDGSNMLIWETVVTSAGDDVPTLPNNFSAWFDDAHRITHRWFESLTSGVLAERYRNGAANS